MLRCMRLFSVVSVVLFLWAQPVFAASAEAGWQWLNPVPTGDDILGVSVLPSGQGWACGKGGTLFGYGPEGLTPLFSPTQDELVCVTAFSPSVIFLASRDDSGRTTTFHLLADGSWSDTGTFVGRPNSIWAEASDSAWATGFFEVDDGQGGTEPCMLLHYDGQNWSPAQGSLRSDLAPYDIWSPYPGIYYLCGLDQDLHGVVLRYDTQAFTTVHTSPSIDSAYYGISGSSENNIVTVGWERPDFLGTIYRFDGTAWQRELALANTSFVDVAVESETIAHACGFLMTSNGGFIVGSDGLGWETVYSDQNLPLISIASGGDTLLAGGSQGALVLGDMRGFTPLRSGLTTTITAMWGFGPQNLLMATSDPDFQTRIRKFQDGLFTTKALAPEGFRATNMHGPDENHVHLAGDTYGNAAMAYFNGDSVQISLDTGLAGEFKDVWSRGRHAFAVGAFEDQEGVEHGWIYSFDGRDWRQELMVPGDSKLNGVWGLTPALAYAVGHRMDNDSIDPLIYEYDGYRWNPMAAPQGNIYLLNVWASGPLEIHVAGYDFTAKQGVVFSRIGHGGWQRVVAFDEPFRPTYADIFGFDNGEVYTFLADRLIHYQNGDGWNLELKDQDFLPATHLWGSEPTNVYYTNSLDGVRYLNGQSWFAAMPDQPEKNDAQVTGRLAQPLTAEQLRQTYLLPEGLTPLGATQQFTATTTPANSTAVFGFRTPYLPNTPADLTLLSLTPGQEPTPFTYAPKAANPTANQWWLSTLDNSYIRPDYQLTPNTIYTINLAIPGNATYTVVPAVQD